MYRLYRLFSSYGYGTNFIHALSFFPQHLLSRMGLVPIFVKHKKS